MCAAGRRDFPAQIKMLGGRRPRSSSRHPVTTLAFGRESSLGTCRLGGSEQITSASFCLQSRVIQVEVRSGTTNPWVLSLALTYLALPTARRSRVHRLPTRWQSLSRGGQICMSKVVPSRHLSLVQRKSRVTLAVWGIFTHLFVQIEVHVSILVTCSGSASLRVPGT